MKSKFWHGRLIGAWLIAALMFSGCGPGVGGTGTGGAFVAFGVSASSVCNGAFAAELSCFSQAPAASGVAAGAAGTLPVQFVDAAGQVTLDLSGNTARLQASCQRLRFVGDFGMTAGGAQGFFGSYEVDANGIELLAALSAAPGVGGGTLMISLRDVDGHVAVQPVLLRRATVPLPAPNRC